MFFEKYKDARIQAKIETQKTGRKHKAVKAKKYLCPPKTHNGKDHIHGYTLVLESK